MLPNFVKVTALSYLENQLSRLREEFMEKVMKGEKLDPAAFQKEETATIKRFETRFYGPKAVAAREKIGLKDHLPEGGRQKLLEESILFCHHKLAEIPFVGMPALEPGNEIR